MFRPIALFIGLRYTRAKRRNHFISFISFASMLGIALGVAVLITVLSVMNGFDDQIRSRFFSIAPEVTILTTDDILKVWKPLSEEVQLLGDVKATAPFVSGKGMLVNQGVVNGVEVLGIWPNQEKHISALFRKMISGSLDSLTAHSFHMVIGDKLAANLGVTSGDKVNLFIPETNATPFGIIPRFRQFTITGVFTADTGFGFDTGVAYINLDDARRLFKGTDSTSGLHIKLKNIYAAIPVSKALEEMLPYNYFVNNWTEQFGAFFSALAMEKTMMFVILLLIVAVAAFNLVSTLVMAVQDKRTDIAILRTLGATPRTIMMIFIVQGAVIGLVGTLLGVIGGVILALNATGIVDWLQHVFHVQFISSSVYFVNYLPSKLQSMDVITIGLSAIALSLVATLYPAWVAFRVQPAEALRYE